MDQIIYAYWNGQQLYDILNAVVLVTGGASAGSFSQLMASIALIAFLVSVGVGLAKLRATDTAVAFMSLTFFYGVFFLPTVTVTIDDIRLNQQYQVANVPLGLALFGGATSNIGHWLTDEYETFFTSVDDEKFSKYGFLFGTRLINELPKQYYKNPSVRENTRNFIINCVNPELDANPQLVNALTVSTNIWGFIAGQSTPALSLNPGRVTPYYNQWANTQSVLPCIGPGGVYDTTGAVGMLNIDTLVGSFNEMNLLGKKLQPGVENNDWMWTEISDFETSMLGISRSATETVRHYALINMMRDANADRADVLGATIAANQLEHSYNIMEILAEGALPKIRNLIEATIYAVFPIVFLIVIGAGASGGKVLTTYAMTAVWVQLWAPLYAVINSFMFHTSSTDLLTLTNSGGATIQTIPHLLSMCASDQAIAGLMTLSVPAIALAIVKGGTVAMSGVVNSLMSPGQSASGRIGSDIGAGNMTLGHVSYGQVNTAPRAVTGAATETRVGPDGSTVTTHADGSSTLDRSPTVSRLGSVETSAATGARSQAAEVSSNKYTAAAEAAGVRAQSLQAAYETAKDYTRSSGSSTRVGSDAGVSNLSKFMRAFEASQATAAKWDAGVRLTQGEKQAILTEASGSLGAGLGGKAGPAGFSAGLKASLAKTGVSEAQMQGLYESARNYAESSGFKAQIHAAQDFSTGISTATGSETGKRASSDVKARLTDADKAEQTQRSSLQQARAYEKVASMISYSDGQTKANLSNYIVGKLGGADRANATLGGMTEAQQMQLVNGLAGEWVKDQAALMQKGDASSNAGVATSSAQGTPAPGAPAAFTATNIPEISDTHTRNVSSVPGNPGAAPSIVLDPDGPGGQPGQTVTPRTVNQAAAAGKDASESGLRDGQNHADAGRKTVVAPVQDNQADPALRSRAGKIFIGHEANEGNPASKTRNTGGADGKWEGDSTSPPPPNTGGADGKW